MSLQPTPADLRAGLARRRARQQQLWLTARLEQQHAADGAALRVGWRLRAAGLAAVVAAWALVRVAGARRVHARALAALPAVAARGPRGRGAVRYSATQVALAAEFPAFYAALGLAFGAPALSDTGARLLLLALQMHGAHMTDAAWAGAPEQLAGGAAAVPRLVGSYAAWSGADNPFRPLLPSRAAFEQSAAVLCARANPGSRSTLHRLLDGGWCGVAAHVPGSAAEAAVMARLTARLTPLRRECGAERTMAAIFSATNALATGLGLAMAFPFLGPLALAAVGLGTATAAAAGGMQAHAGTQCRLGEGEVSLGAGWYADGAEARCDSDT